MEFRFQISNLGLNARDAERAWNGDREMLTFNLKPEI